MNLKSLLLILIGLLFIGCNPNTLSPSSYSQTAKSEAILTLDTKGHIGMIWDVIVSKSGDIISASDDKTIRIWDSKTGKEKRKILGQIGTGSEGIIYAIALSPNEEFLAVGGFLANLYNLEEACAIRIYNYKSGKLLKVIKSHRDVIKDLAFSSDGKYLISASADKTSKIWDGKTFKLLDTIKFHSKSVYAVKIIKKANTHFAITAGFDNKIAMYNIEKKKVVASHKLDYKLQYVAVSKKNIAVCGYEKEIQIYNHNLEHIKTISSENQPAGLAYSPNGEFLIVGTGGNPNNVNIYNSNHQKIQSFKKHNNTTMAVAFLNNKTAISGGGGHRKISIWDIKSGKVLKKIEGVGSSFRLFPKPLSINKGIYSLKAKKGGKYKLNNAILDIKKDGKTVASIIRDGTNGVKHNCYGFYKNYIVSGGDTGKLLIYNLKGIEVLELIGHTGPVLSLTIDKNRLVSVSSDQTMRVWYLDKLKIGDKKQKIYESHLVSQMKKLKLTRNKVIKKASIDNNLYSYIHITPTIYSQVNSLKTGNNEWVTWTKEGFYDTSKGGEKYIGYHINQGFNKEAKFLDISRFRKQFYRPDLISKAIKGENISSYTKSINIDALLNAGLPPKVKILTDSHTIDKDSTTIGVNVCDTGGGFDNLNFYMDGKAIGYLSQTKAFRQKKEQIKNCTTIEQTISVPNGKHVIGFDATNKEGNIISNKSIINVISTKKVKNKPNLHLLTLSINDYKDDSLDLKFPNNDADELSSKLKEVGKPIFNHVYSYSLKDSQVTQKEINKKVAEIAKKVDVEDIFVLYISGHGITNDADGDYYFIPYNCANGSDVTKNAINQDEFKKIMSQIKAVKSVILLDTCESGSMASKELVNTSVNRFGGNVGSAIIAGATSKQNAIDGYKNHGIFTYTLLDAMSNKKVYDFQDRLTITDIAKYVKYMLPKLAKENFGHKQEPTVYLNGDTTFAVGGL